MHGLSSLISFHSPPNSHISHSPFLSFPSLSQHYSLCSLIITNAMGRPPGNGGPAFRFTPSEVSEMEDILVKHDNKLPPRDQFVALAEKFSNGPERFQKSTVQMKQVMNWFQNKRYALKAKSSKATQKLDVAPLQAVPSLLVPGQAPVLQVHLPPVRQEVNGSPTSNIPRSFAPHSGKALSNVEFEARSARDGAWYDVAAFLSLKNKDTDDPEVLVRFAGLTAEEDEWIKVSKHVRHRSLPCEASECVAVLPSDLILCFQEAPEQALYFDAHVLDARRFKHDSRSCHCQFLVRYDHDQSEEAVSLRKICRRPETDYRLQIYQALRDLPAQPVPVKGQVESMPMNEKVETMQQKTTSAVDKSTGVHAEEANDDIAPKATHRADETLDQDVARKKARISVEMTTQDAGKEEAGDSISTKPESPKELAAVTTSATIVAEEEDHAKLNVAVEEGSNSSNPAAAALTCQNQTNGHSITNAGSSGSSDVPVGAQQCF